MRWICEPHVAMERRHHLRIERRLRCFPTESSDTRAPIGTTNLMHSTGDSIAIAIAGIGEFTNHRIRHMFKQPEADDLRPDAQRHANFTEWAVRGVLHAEIPAFEFGTRTIDERDERTLRLQFDAAFRSHTFDRLILQLRAVHRMRCTISIRWTHKEHTAATNPNASNRRQSATIFLVTRATGIG